MKKYTFTIVLVLILCNAFAQQLAFPGAEGFGRFATGGRGGEVYHVTNLNDSGAGSLRDAVSKPNRIVVFDVGGVINITSRIVIQKNIYVAGQTAPGGGITIYGDGVALNSSSGNSIVRYIRIRMGENGEYRKDALGISDGQNYMFDNVSISWGWDGTVDVNGTNIDNITFQDCIISQGIDIVGHSTGGLMQSGKWSAIRTIYIDNETRNPKGKGTHEVMNCLIYNWGSAGYIMGDTDGLSEVNCVGNWFIAGPSSAGGTYITRTTTAFHVYAKDNWVDDNKNGLLDPFLLTDYKTATVINTPFAYNGMNKVMPANTALQYVIDHAGASMPRDAVDNYLINEILSYGKKGAIIVRESDNGIPNNVGTVASGIPPLDTDRDGMPDVWEINRGLNPNVADDKGDDDGDGYTNIEEYLSCLAGDIDCSNMNTNSPKVTITSPITGTTVFSPTTIFFTANATDTDGSVTKVEFFRGSTSLGIGTANGSIFSHTWTNVPIGSYSITAVATDNKGNKSTSTPINITVVLPITAVYQHASSDVWTNTANWNPILPTTPFDTAIIRSGEVKVSGNIAPIVKVEPNGIFRLTANVATPDLRLQGGTLKSFTSSPLFAVTSTITVEQASTIWAGSLTTSVFQIDGIIKGNGNLTKTYTGIVSLTADATAYTGNWNITEGTLRIANTKSIGQNSVEIATGATLTIAAANVSIDSVALNGTLVLDNNVTVRVCTIAGKSIPAGVYRAADYPATITGTGTLTVLACYTCGVTQTIVLTKGWNLFSTNIDATNTSIETVFNGLDVVTIKNAHGFWKAGQNTAFNSLQTITAGEGYLIYMNAAGTLTIFGTPCTGLLQYAPTGWQLIGCQYKTSTPFSTQFNTTNCQIIKNFDGFWEPNGTTNSIQNIEPGKAYFIKKI